MLLFQLASNRKSQLQAEVDRLTPKKTKKKTPVKKSPRGIPLESVLYNPFDDKPEWLTEDTANRKVPELWPDKEFWYQHIILFVWEVPETNPKRFWKFTVEQIDLRRWFVEGRPWLPKDRLVTYLIKNLDKVEVPLRYSILMKIQFEVSSSRLDQIMKDLEIYYKDLVNSYNYDLRAAYQELVLRVPYKIAYDDNKRTLKELIDKDARVPRKVRGFVGKPQTDVEDVIDPFAESPPPPKEDPLAAKKSAKRAAEEESQQQQKKLKTPQKSSPRTPPPSRASQESGTSSGKSPLDVNVSYAQRAIKYQMSAQATRREAAREEDPTLKRQLLEKGDAMEAAAKRADRRAARQEKERQERLQQPSKKVTPECRRRLNDISSDLQKKARKENEKEEEGRKIRSPRSRSPSVITISSTHRDTDSVVEAAANAAAADAAAKDKEQENEERKQREGKKKTTAEYLQDHMQEKSTRAEFHDTMAEYRACIDKAHDLITTQLTICRNVKTHVSLITTHLFSGPLQEMEREWDLMTHRLQDLERNDYDMRICKDKEQTLHAKMVGMQAEFPDQRKIPEDLEEPVLWDLFTKDEDLEEHIDLAAAQLADRRSRLYDDTTVEREKELLKRARERGEDITKKGKGSGKGKSKSSEVLVSAKDISDFPPQTVLEQSMEEPAGGSVTNQSQSGLNREEDEEDRDDYEVTSIFGEETDTVSLCTTIPYSKNQNRILSFLPAKT